MRTVKEEEDMILEIYRQYKVTAYHYYLVSPCKFVLSEGTGLTPGCKRKIHVAAVPGGVSVHCPHTDPTYHYTGHGDSLLLWNYLH